MAVRTEGSGRVRAFEPDSTNFGLLERTVAANSWSHVSPRRAACGDRPGRMSLHTDPDNWGNHSLTTDGELHQGASTEIDVVTLDDVAGDLDPWTS